MEINVDPSLYEGKVVCFDTETTGFTKWDEIIQISIVNEDEKEVLTTFIKPDHKKSWDDAQAINGISPEMVKDAPSMKELKKTLRKIFDGAKEILGYNVAFDVRMVQQCAYYEFDKDKVTDVLKQFKKDKPDKDSHKLIDAVRFYLDKDFLEEFENGAHKADMDTFATVKVWKRQQELLKERAKEEKAPVKEQGTQFRKNNVNPVKFYQDEIHYAGIGARTTPKEILEIFERMGSWLANKGLVLRSGRAQGADLAFEKGCDAVGGKKEIYLPWSKFNKDVYDNHDGAVWSKVGTNAETIAKRFHGGYPFLSRGARALMARNTYQMIGECDENVPKASAFVICYTPFGEGGGGTGQALRIARAMGIPVFDAGKYERLNMTANAVKGSQRMGSLDSFDIPTLKSDFNAFIKDVLSDKEYLNDLSGKAMRLLNETTRLNDVVTEKEDEREDY